PRKRSRTRSRSRIRSSYPPLRALLHDVVARAPGERHDGPRRVLVRLRYERCAIDGEQIRDVVRLAPAIQHRCGAFGTHACAAELVDDAAASRDTVAVLAR